MGQAMADLKAANDILRQSMQEWRRSSSEHNADVIEVLGNWRVIEDTTTGERRTVPLTDARDVIEDLNRVHGMGCWKEVPLHTCAT
jgi:hypothetical protein